MRTSVLFPPTELSWGKCQPTSLDLSSPFTTELFVSYFQNLLKI